MRRVLAARRSQFRSWYIGSRLKIMQYFTLAALALVAGQVAAFAPSSARSARASSTVREGE